MNKIIIILIALWSQINLAQTPLGDYFTYQGELLANGQSMTGNYDFSVNVYNTATGGVNVGGQFFSNVTVTNGLFTLTVDLGNALFAGDERWLELSVSTVNAPTLTTLSPRQLISNAPFAIHAQFVGLDGVDSFAIQNSSVTTAKIADGAVTSIKLANSAVTSNKIGIAAVGSTQIATASVGSTHIVDLSVTTADLNTGAVTTAKIANAAVTSAKIANGTIDTVDISSQAITRVQIAANTIQRSEVDSTQIQERVTGTCAAGSSIRVIAQDGTVTCETDDTGTPFAGWGLAGNAGTTPGTNFIGTTDNKSLEFKVNNVTGMRIIQGTANGDTTPNMILGSSTNFISQISSGSSIVGGIGNKINGKSPGFYASGTFIGGGRNNVINNNESVITGGLFNVIDATQSFIGAGNGNQVHSDAIGSVVVGGQGNTAYGSHSSILGGVGNKTYGVSSLATGGGNTAGGDYSAALGKDAVIRTATQVGSGTTGDIGSFIWSQSGVTSTGSNQVLFEAIGGFGIGTNEPAAPLHVKGQGTSAGSTASSNEVVMTIEPKVSSNNVATVINKLDATKESALIFSTAASPNFDLRAIQNSFTRDQLDFNHYDSMGNKQTLMSLEYYDAPTSSSIYLNADIFPDNGSTYTFGASTNRWKHIYTQNITSSTAVTVDSDRRLKDDIENLSYGLADILALRPVSYSLKADSDKKTQLGLIAQEVEAIIPEIVKKAKNKKQLRSMSYTELVPVLIKATQEQQALIDQQNKKIEHLETMLEKLIQNNLK